MKPMPSPAIALIVPDGTTRRGAYLAQRSGTTAPSYERVPWNEVGLTRVEGAPMADDQHP